MNKEKKQIEKEVCISRIYISKEWLREHNKEITMMHAKLEDKIDRLNEIKEQIPNFDMETYKKYKEYFSAEDEIKDLQTAIDGTKMRITKTIADISINEEKVKKIEAELDSLKQNNND